jgi:hypothetical protein
MVSQASSKHGERQHRAGSSPVDAAARLGREALALAVTGAGRGAVFCG